MVYVGNRGNFDVVPLCAHTQTNRHTVLSQNSDIVPYYLSHMNHTEYT